MSAVLDVLQLNEAPEPVDDFADAYDTDVTAELRLVEKLSGLYDGRIADRVAFILDFVHEAEELTLLSESDLLDVGMLPCYVTALKSAMAQSGLTPRPQRQRLFTRLTEYYGTPEKIPLRMLFFNSPLPGKLSRVGIRSLGTLLTLTSLQVACIGRRVGAGNGIFVPLLNADDIFELSLVFHECGLQLVDGMPVRW